MRNKMLTIVGERREDTGAFFLIDAAAAHTLVAIAKDAPQPIEPASRDARLVKDALAIVDCFLAELQFESVFRAAIEAEREKLQALASIENCRRF